MHGRLASSGAALTGTSRPGPWPRPNRCTSTCEPSGTVSTSASKPAGPADDVHHSRCASRRTTPSARQLARRLASPRFHRAGSGRCPGARHHAHVRWREISDRSRLHPRHPAQPPSQHRPATTTPDPAAATPNGLDSLRARLYACYGWAQSHVVAEGDTLDRLSILGALGRTESPAERREAVPQPGAGLAQRKRGQRSRRAPTGG